MTPEAGMKTKQQLMVKRKIRYNLEQGFKRMTHNASRQRGMANRKSSTSFGDSSKKKIKENQRHRKEKQQKHLFQQINKKILNQN